MKKGGHHNPRPTWAMNGARIDQTPSQAEHGLGWRFVFQGRAPKQLASGRRPRKRRNDELSS